MSDAAKYQRDARLPFQEIQGQAVVVVPARRELHEMDETATFLWAELAKPRTVRDLADALCAEFEVGVDVAEADVKEFLRSLEDKGLVSRA